ncbi:MAG: 50S ribosomal protein L32e [Promethearchaeota archaeon]
MKQLDTDTTRLLKLREKQSRKRPSFRRVESWRYVRVKDSWRRARGIDSKTRRKKKSGVKSPHDGYRGPKSVRGIHPSGYIDVLINNGKEIDLYDPEVHAIRISRRIGARKRLKILDALQEKGFKVLNPGMTEKELEEIRDIIKGEEIGEDGIEWDEEEVEVEEDTSE